MGKALVWAHWIHLEGAQASPSFSLLSEALDVMKMRLLDFLVVSERGSGGPEGWREWGCGK